RLRDGRCCNSICSAAEIAKENSAAPAGSNGWTTRPLAWNGFVPRQDQCRHCGACVQGACSPCKGYEGWIRCRTCCFGSRSFPGKGTCSSSCASTLRHS